LFVILTEAQSGIGTPVGSTGPQKPGNLSAFFGCHSGSGYLQPTVGQERSASSGCPMRRICAWGFFLLLLLTSATFTFAQKKPPAKPIDINTASIEQLEQLPGIGPVTAKSIFDFRKKSGPFRRPEDLLGIRGISAKRYKAIAPYVTVSQAKPAAPPKATAPKPQGTTAKPATPAAPKPAPAPKPASPAR
jgi:competence ComEA-like helix-hairpin-helix protein